MLFHWGLSSTASRKWSECPPWQIGSQHEGGAGTLRGHRLDGAGHSADFGQCLGGANTLEKNAHRCLEDVLRSKQRSHETHPISQISPAQADPTGGFLDLKSPI